VGAFIFSIKFFQPTYTRISCFPLGSEKSEINLAVANSINQVLQRKNFRDKHIVIYNLENTFESINCDSAGQFPYLMRFGKAVQLDYLFLVNSPSVLDNYGIVNIYFINFKKDSTHMYVDTLFFSHPQSFFINFRNKFCKSRENNYFINQQSLLHTRLQWETWGRGIFYILTNQYLEAEKVFQKLSVLLPDNQSIKKQFISVLLQKAILFKSQGKFNKDIYDQIFNLVGEGNDTEKDTVFSKLLGIMYIQNENWNFAFEKLNKALQINATDPETFFYLSKLHASRLRALGYSTNIAILKKAIFFNPAYLPACLTLGQIYVERREFKKAEKIYRTILSINPRSVDALHGLGTMYLLQNNPVDFINIYKKILEIDPDNSNAYYNLGIAYLNTRDSENAERFFQRSIEIDNLANSYFYLGVIYALRNNKTKAISYFSQRITSGKDDEYAQEARKAIRKLQNNEKIIHLRSFHGFGN